MLFLALSLALAGPGPGLADPALSPNGMRAVNAEAAAPTPEAQPGFTSLLHFDALLPSEILVDGVKLAQLWFPGKASFALPPGPHMLRIYTQGKPHDMPLNLVADAELSIVVGRTGITAEEQVATVDDGVTAPVEFRVLGARGASLRIDGDRHSIPAGGHLQLQLANGVHNVSVRSGDGTVIWASGRLNVTGGPPLIVQMSEGRLPEVSGGGTFDAGSGG